MRLPVIRATFSGQNLWFFEKLYTYKKVMGSVFRLLFFLRTGAPNPPGPIFWPQNHAAKNNEAKGQKTRYNKVPDKTLKKWQNSETIAQIMVVLL